MHASSYLACDETHFGRGLVYASSGLDIIPYLRAPLRSFAFVTLYLIHPLFKLRGMGSTSTAEILLVVACVCVTFNSTLFLLL